MDSRPGSLIIYTGTAMITKDFIKECLDILDLKYTEVDDENLAVSFFDKEAFPYQIVTFIHVGDDDIISFSSQAFDYHPEGDLLALANRHNCRFHAPACHIDSDGEIIMDRMYVIKAEVSPHYVLENVIRPSVFLPVDAFMAFELSNEELEARRNRE